MPVGRARAGAAALRLLLPGQEGGAGDRRRGGGDAAAARKAGVIDLEERRRRAGALTAAGAATLRDRRRRAPEHLISGPAQLACRRGCRPSLRMTSQAQSPPIGDGCGRNRGVGARPSVDKAGARAAASANGRDDGLSQAVRVRGRPGHPRCHRLARRPRGRHRSAVPRDLRGLRCDRDRACPSIYRYQAQTARQDEGKPWTRRTH